MEVNFNQTDEVTKSSFVNRCWCSIVLSEFCGSRHTESAEANRLFCECWFVEKPQMQIRIWNSYDKCTNSQNHLSEISKHLYTMKTNILLCKYLMSIINGIWYDIINNRYFIYLLITLNFGLCQEEERFKSFPFCE